MPSLVVVVRRRGRFTRSLREFWKFQGSVGGFPKASRILLREGLITPFEFGLGAAVPRGPRGNLDERNMATLVDNPSIAVFEQELQVARLIASLLACDLL